MPPESRALLIAQPLVLPRGPALKNRLAKSALSEALGSPENRVTPELVRLYRCWASSGAGLLMTGNVMIDRRAVGEPGNVVLEDARDMARLREWAAAGASGGSALWMQINHPGKQAPRGLNRENVSPSAVPFGPKLASFFPVPRALTGPEIEDIIRRYGNTAALAKEAGFGGVQLHGAHGYLISQFLSPHHNRREDEWGGTAVKRRRFVMDVYREVRRRVGKDFPIGIKLNSADFQRGGFAADESERVALLLEAEGIDLLEISGGTYEQPQLLGLAGKRADSERPRAASTRAREAYFLDYAASMRKAIRVPLAVTGGFRSLAAMREALAGGDVDVIGIARPQWRELGGHHNVGAWAERNRAVPLLVGFIEGLRSVFLLCPCQP